MPRTTLLAVTALTVLAAGCGNSSANPVGFVPGSDAGDDGGPTNPAISVTVSPKTAQVALAQSGAAFAAAATFTAQATFQDGSSSDVTATASWAASDPTLVAVAKGVATASAPGVFTITAADGPASDSATLTVTLSGPVYGGGLGPADGGKLDGTPTGSGATIAYPLAGALFPTNLAPVTVHVAKTSAAQSIARVSLEAPPLIAVHYYAPCEQGPDPQTACYVTLPDALTSLLAAAGDTTDIALQARVAAKDGSALVETAPISLAWTSARLTGGLYYWTTIPPTQNNGSTGICRYDFDGDHSKPQTVYTDKASPPDHVDGATCVGCHAITHDGKKMALTIGGSLPSDWMLLDIGTLSRIALQNQAGFATETTFNADGSRMVNMYRGDFTLRATDMTLAAQGAVLASVTEKKTDAFWSADGKLFAFATWVPGQNGALPTTDPNGLNGDTKQGAQIWTAPSDGATVVDQPKLLVPRAPGVTSFYPAISDDGRLVVFDQSSCSGPPTSGGYGDAPCDGYDDVSSRLFVIPPAGGSPIALDRANGVSNSSNSWPRWSPDSGTFRGKTLYWIAFSSRRRYGLALNPLGDASGKPQLWFAAIAVDPAGGVSADPSFAPVWLPGQDPDLTAPNGNHVPQWVTKAVPIEK
jgi:hypothetical protein